MSASETHVRTPTAECPVSTWREAPELFDFVAPPLDRAGRSSGVHVSGVVSLLGRSIKAKGCDYGDPDESSRAGLSLMADLGFAWEDLLSRAVANVWMERHERRGGTVSPDACVFRPDPIHREIVCPVTGRTEMLHASPDGICTDLFGAPGIIECKVRYADMREPWDPSDPRTIAWKQMMQTMAYARMLELDRAVLAALHINGAYSSGRPGFARFVCRYVEFDRAFLEAWFDKIIVPTAFRARREG